MNKEFVYSDLFKVLPQSFKVSKLEFVCDGKTPAYSADTRNNGRVGFVDREPFFKITKSTPVYLVFGEQTRTMNIVREDFCVMDNVKVLVPLINMTDEMLLYVTTCWKKAIPHLGYARHWSVAKTAKFELPVIVSADPHHEYTVNDIDFAYMHKYIVEFEKERILELEQARIIKLNAYLEASGLDNYELTDEDKAVLSLSSNNSLAKTGLFIPAVTAASVPTSEPKFDLASTAKLSSTFSPAFSPISTAIAGKATTVKAAKCAKCKASSLEADAGKTSTLDSFDTLDSDCSDGQVVFQSFKIGSVFHKVDASCKKKDFDKKRDTSTVQNEEFSVPLVNAKLGDNGIMFYGRKSDWNTQEMCIDVIQNGAIATGTVYVQPYAVGVLWDAILLKPMVEVNSVEVLLYMAKCLEKVTKEKFSYDKKVTWDRIKAHEITLPVTEDGSINFDFMERYIRAIQKLVIADMVQSQDEMIAAVSKIVST